jgi:hypothetical protein
MIAPNQRAYRYPVRDRFSIMVWRDTCGWHVMVTANDGSVSDMLKPTVVMKSCIPFSAVPKDAGRDEMFLGLAAALAGYTKDDYPAWCGK